ncbi:acetylglutamate kinase [Spirochaetota bacterium]
MKELLKKAEILIEAFPYIKEFSGKTFVIKYGGSAMADEGLKRSVMEDIVLMKFVGINPIIVHGGGKHISDLLARLGKKSTFVDGLRVTDKDTMDVTLMVLAGLLNKEIVSMIHNVGGQAVGISGKDGNCIEGKRIKSKKADFGFVGEITKINPAIIDILDSAKFIPVLSPIAIGKNGESLNINADVAASEIAGVLKAEKLIFLTDIKGILKDKNKESSLYSHLNIKECRELIKKGIASEGMLPKIDSCIKALSTGVRKIHIINGKTPHGLLLEIFTKHGIGTEIVK